MASTESLQVTHTAVLRAGNPAVSGNNQRILFNIQICLEDMLIRHLVCVQIQVNADDTEQQYWSLDLILCPVEDHDNGQFSTYLDIGPSESPPLLVLNESIASASLKIPEMNAIRFIFSKKDGQVARCDFLERRLECCEHVAKDASFLSPLQSVASADPSQVTSDHFCDILSKAVGGVRVRDCGSKDPVKRILRASEAAWALGISIVIIDQAGHWLQDDNGPYSHLRESFIPLNIDVDEGFTQRIVDAIRGHPQEIVGIMTISDIRLPGIAKACEILGLPTSAYDAYAIAADKAKTRMLEEGSDESFTLSSAEELQAYLSNRQGRPLEFPMVVSNEADLAEAVRKAAERHPNSPKQSTAVVVEPYIDGPEVDANFVLLDGEILFFEICDDFPCKGDAEDAGLEDNFQETQMVFPTSLPDREMAAIRDSIHKSILRQGFSSGVFHCEARVRYSRVHYRVQDGILDLEKKTEVLSHEVSVYLLEINARPPGYPVSVAVQLCYGVDYYALRLLQCMGSAENTRVRALGQPFLNGPRFTLAITVIPQKQAGIMKTTDAGLEFLERHDQLRDQIPDYKTSRKGGDIIEGPSSNALWPIAYFSAFSRVGRRDCLQLAQFIREKCSYEVE
ncbi:ATP-grasp superfamily protein [Rutstroemia sp. NJR-2017a WRK4]|nr:ATP-grasp superfamily protein [Rutstroemia sp. NJR-2017a WRK4]